MKINTQRSFTLRWLCMPQEKQNYFDMVFHILKSYQNQDP